jgi:predicted O-linked N-acetylglucosamine transferase (SPINDLY family)
LSERPVVDPLTVEEGAGDGPISVEKSEASFGRFVDVQPTSDEEVVELIGSMEIDVLVDLKRFTRDARTGVFARRPAPSRLL